MMSSWSKVKEEVLVACKRYCCYCERYKGINIEVHHIVQRTDGGEDSFDNAIPLCFDCHSMIGSYNPKHPKGNKFSSGELKQIRDAFYVKVQDLPRYETYSEHDKNLIDEFKKSFTKYIEYCIDTDFSAEPVNMYLADELSNLIRYWHKKKNTFESVCVENTKVEILRALSDLCNYLTPVYFHDVGYGRILFNSSSLEDGVRIEKLRNATMKIRTNLAYLLERLYSL
ncbi:HNH endonuclease [Lachnospiraceae bacterium]|nr:HNH endonuclease [Lachnospiraceae bacterium]